jgi:hypothetical protein
MFNLVLQACNALGVCCVPLYDSLGKNAHRQINWTAKSLANQDEAATY